MSRLPYFAMLYCLFSIRLAGAIGTAFGTDTIPSCREYDVYDLKNFLVSRYEFDSIVTFREDIGYFNWGPSSGNFVIVRNLLEGGQLTFMAFDTLNYLVYSQPFAQNNWYENVRTDIQMDSGYKTLAAYQDMVFVHKGYELYKYRLGGSLQLLRNDVHVGMSQQVVDGEYHFIYLSDFPDQNFRSDAVHVSDSTGVITYRFEFSPPLNTYNMQSLFMVHDSLYAITSSLNQTYGRALLHIRLDFDHYTAEAVPVASSQWVDGLVHAFSCAPGKLVEGRIPNVHIEPGLTSIITTKEGLLRLYPNPVDEILTIQSLTNQPYQYTIVSVYGQTVKSGRLTQDVEHIDVSDLPEGLYVFCLMENQNAILLAVDKFVKVE